MAMCHECMEYVFSIDEYAICFECQIQTCDECNRRCDFCSMIFCGECFEGHSREEEAEEEEEEEFEGEEVECPIDSPTILDAKNGIETVPSSTDEADEEDISEC